MEGPIIDAEVVEEPQSTYSSSSNVGIAVRAREKHGLSDYMPGIRRSPDEVKRSIEDIDRVAKEHMRDGIDYMVIPGTNKPTITKAGAERLSRFFGFFARTELVERVLERGPGEPFVMYTYNTVIGPLNDAGEIVPLANAEGSANSWEAKWRYRNARPACPDCGAQVLIHTRKNTFWCPADKGGCGHSFPDTDTRITGQSVGRVPNDDVWSQVNAIQKIAQKRSYVGAVLIATGSSEYFTQDMEDAAQSSAPPPPAEKAKAQPRKPAKPKVASQQEIDDLFAMSDALGISHEDVQAGLDTVQAKWDCIPAELVQRKLVALSEQLNLRAKETAPEPEPTLEEQLFGAAKDDDDITFS